jgi:hypothetical protein
VRYLGQSIHNHPNGIVPRLSSRQTHYKFYGKLFPLPLRHMQRLQQSSRSLMLGFDSLTSVAKNSILGNVSLHTIPPISGIEIMAHLIPSGMNGISTLICFMKYLILQLLDVRHTDPSFVPQHSLIILRKTMRLLFLDVVLYLLDLLIFHLTSTNLLKQTRNNFHLHNFCIGYNLQHSKLIT